MFQCSDWHYPGIVKMDPESHGFHLLLCFLITTQRPRHAFTPLWPLSALVFLHLFDFSSLSSHAYVGILEDQGVFLQNPLGDWWDFNVDSVEKGIPTFEKPYLWKTLFFAINLQSLDCDFGREGYEFEHYVKEQDLWFWWHLGFEILMDLDLRFKH